LLVLDFPYKSFVSIASLTLTKLTPFMLLLVDGFVVQGSDIVLMIWVGSALQGRDIGKRAKLW
jgi:hypothetical protein